MMTTSWANSQECARREKLVIQAVDALAAGQAAAGTASAACELTGMRVTVYAPPDDGRAVVGVVTDRWGREGYVLLFRHNSPARPTRRDLVALAERVAAEADGYDIVWEVERPAGRTI